MRDATLEVLRDWRTSYLADSGKVMEIGALDVNGSPRSIFEGADIYFGIDIEAGPGVDAVISSHDLSRLSLQAYDLVLCLDTLEHDEHPHKTMRNVSYVLRPGGYLALGVPTIEFPFYHGHPAYGPTQHYEGQTNDYWRFTMAGVAVLLREAGVCTVELREICTWPPYVDTIIVLGRKQ